MEHVALHALWPPEAESRLAAYRAGQIKAIPLADVLAKYEHVPRRAVLVHTQAEELAFLSEPGSSI